MDIFEMRKEPHLSASGIRDYMECGLLYRFSRIDGIDPEFRSDSLEFGSTIHKVLAHFHEMKMIGESPTLPEMQSAFEEYWRRAAEGREDIRYSKGKSFDVLLREGKELLRAYYDELPRDSFKVLAIEEPFRISIDSVPVPLIGVFDLVEADESGTIIITDWKTTNRSYSKDDVDGSFQLTVYSLAAHLNGFQDREILLRFDCLIKTQKPSFTQYYTSRGREEHQKAVKKIQQVWDAIRKGVFIPNDGGWKCKSCSYKRRCTEWFAAEGSDG